MPPSSADPMDHLPTGLKLFVRNLQSLTPAKLDDSNYPSWSETLRANLMAHRLLSYVDGTEPAPPSLILDEKAAISRKEDSPVMKANPAYETWMIVDAQIRACLLAVISPTVQTHIHTLPTSAAIWSHLEQRYNSLSRTHIFQLKERLHSLQKWSDTMQTYLDNVLNIVSSLTLAHESISDQDVILCILRGLPAEYSSLKQNIRTNIGNVNINQVSAWLLSEELNVTLEKKLQLNDSASASTSDVHNVLYTTSGRGNLRGRGRGGYRGRNSSKGGSTYGGRGSRSTGSQRDDYRGRGGRGLDRCRANYAENLDMWSGIAGTVLMSHILVLHKRFTQLVMPVVGGVLLGIQPVVEPGVRFSAPLEERSAARRHYLEFACSFISWLEVGLAVCFGLEGRREDGAKSCRMLRSLVLVSVLFPIAWAALVCLFALYYDLDHGLILDLRWNCFVVVLGQLKGFPLSMVFASFGRHHHLIWSWVLCLLLHLGLAGRLPRALLDPFG
ncbi:unnamed protein product [Cuscuta campestris]|uniref:Uncharacterized protein n=1 Tax=Cuscuta campestris TaxID=132261 RepID=A0A484NB53_9ASTE|nr:unnamed protein product [Cuscuta campestris]